MVAKPEISISHRTRATIFCCSGGSGGSSSGSELLILIPCRLNHAAGKPRNRRDRAPARPAQRLDRVLASATALSRTRLKGLIQDGAVSIGARTIRDPGYRVNAGETVQVAVPEPEPAEPAAREHPAQHRVRGRRDHRHRQAGRPGGASGGGARHRHAGQRADRPLRRQPVRHRRGEAAGHRAPARQGHHRADGGGQDRPRAPALGRAVRRSRPHRAARARLPGVRLGRAGAAEGHHRRAASTGIRRAATAWRCGPAAARRSPTGRCWSAFGKAGTTAKAGGEPDRMPAGDRPHPSDPGASGAHRPSAAGRRNLCGPASRPRPAGCRRRPSRRWAGLDDRRCMLIYWRCSIPFPGKSWSSDRNCRLISLRLHHSLSAG